MGLGRDLAGTASEQHERVGIWHRGVGLGMLI